MSEINVAGDIGSASPAQPVVHHLRRALIIWAVLSVIGIALVIVLAPFFLPPAASGLDSDDNFTIVVFSVLSVPVAFSFLSFLPTVCSHLKSERSPQSLPLPYSPVRCSLSAG